MAKNYRKKPIEVEEMQYTGTPESAREAVAWTKDSKTPARYAKVKVGDSDLDDQYREKLYIKTLEGNMVVSVGDFIIKGVKGEYYPCKSNIFRETYEEC